MTGPLLPGGRRAFDPAELDGVEGATPADVAGEARVARSLERVAAQAAPGAGPAFADRVMAAITAEPVPAPARAARAAVRRRAAGAFLASLRDAFRVTLGSGFPLAVRAQALALVLVVAVVATGSGIATAGALGLLGGPRGTPAPSIEQPSDRILPVPSPSVSPADVVAPSVAPAPSEEPSGSIEPAETREPAETETAEPDETHGGSGGDSGDDDRATETPDGDDHETPEPDEPDDDDAEGTPEPSRTPKPGETPRPTEAPHDDEIED